MYECVCGGGGVREGEMHVGINLCNERRLVFFL